MVSTCCAYQGLSHAIYAEHSDKESFVAWNPMEKFGVRICDAHVVDCKAEVLS